MCYRCLCTYSVQLYPLSSKVCSILTRFTLHSYLTLTTLHRTFFLRYTDVVQNTSRDYLWYITGIYIQLFEQASPSSFQSTITVFHYHSNFGESIVKPLMLTGQMSIVRIGFHQPWQQWVCRVTKYDNWNILPGYLFRISWTLLWRNDGDMGSIDSSCTLGKAKIVSETTDYLSQSSSRWKHDILR